MHTLRPYQRRAIDEGIYAHFAAHPHSNPVLALPTGSGKSLVIAEFLRECFTRWPNQRVICLQHVRELIRQNYLELMGQWPDAPAGIYSAGLKRRDTRTPILFASIQSVAHRAQEIGWCDLLLIDEAHMVPRNAGTRYRKFIAALRAYNPAMKVIGLTASPYRLDSGMLTDGKDRIFTHISIDLTLGDEFVRLIDDGYLSPLRTKATVTSINVTGVHSRGGDFIASELSAAVGAEGLIEAGLDEAIAYGHDRAAWLFFFPSVATAMTARDYLRSKGVAAECIHGELSTDERDSIMAGFKSGAIRAVTNVEVMTTGTNVPTIDLIGMFRPTQSPGLHVQMIGRALRRAPGKTDALILDYAGNTARLGPINRVNIPRRSRGGGPPGEAPTKTCPQCAEIVFCGCRSCPACGHEFPKPEPEIAPRASAERIIARAEDLIEKIAVTRVLYARHSNANGESLKVSYDTGLKHYHEWVLIGRAGFPGRRAANWWRTRSDSSEQPPATVDDALARTQELRVPGAIVIDHNGKYPEIIAHDFTTTAEKCAPTGRLAIDQFRRAPQTELPDLRLFG